MVNRCLALFLTLLLAGCSSIDLSDIATTTGAGVGAVGTAALTTNPAGILVGTVAGGVAGAALVEDGTDPIDACLENPEICREIEFWDTIKDSIHWFIGGGIVLIIAAWLIPGPQTLWRKKDAQPNSPRQRVGYRRSN